MRGSRRLRGRRSAAHVRMARAKPRRGSSPRRGNWRSEATCDTLDGRLGLFDDTGAEGQDDSEADDS
jgi:hypothetical protein